MRTLPAAVAALLLVFVGMTRADDPLIADRYPGDVGIGSDPDVLFAEDFEGAALADVVARWDEASNAGGRVLSLIDDAPEGSAGGRSLKIEAHPGIDTGGHLYTRLKRPVDEYFVRFYVKFPEPAGTVHHFVHMGGYNPATGWPQGGAGERPRGDERITVGIEPFGRDGRVPPPGEWNFYAYWHEMKRSADGRYWGNGLSPIRPERVPAGRWQCVEVRVKLNTPGRRDGVLTLWLDGREAAHIEQGVRRGPWTGMGFDLASEGGEPFEGFDFRTSADLKLNFVWLLHYVTEASQARNRAADPTAPVSVQFDQVVCATRPIGPVRAAADAADERASLDSAPAALRRSSRLPRGGAEFDEPRGDCAMKPSPILVPAALGLLAALTAAARPGDDFRPLFDGTSLEGWKALDMGYWSVRDGAITGESTPDHPCTANQFLVWQGGDVSDFELKLKFRVKGNGGNSGIQFRSVLRPDGLAVGYQADILQAGPYLGGVCDEMHNRQGPELLSANGRRSIIDAHGKRTSTELGTPATMRPAGEWNDYRIRAVGQRITLEVNGVTATELLDQEDGQFDLSGFLGLQLRAGEPMTVQFKDIEYREL